MSHSNKVIYPPDDVLNPKFRKNYEYILLWMLSNNPKCEWSDFKVEICESTLSDHLKRLLSKGYIEKPTRNRYQITNEGRIRFNELTYFSKSGKRRLSYPPEVMLKKRNYDHWILWMLYNNEYCQWSDFRADPLEINQSSLSKNLTSLMDEDLIINENKEYKITLAGKSRYFQILKLYDLDRQSILEEESKRIEEITEKTSQFFKKYEIQDEELKFRFLNNVLKLDYANVKDFLDEEDFSKILLYLSINHPNRYPNFISSNEFSIKYEIKKTTLDFCLDKIVEEDFFPIKFFKLESVPDRIYYFQKGEKIEKMIQAVVEDHITRFTYLYKFNQNNLIRQKSLNSEDLIEKILTDLCDNVINENLKDSLRKFIPSYINYLAYKIETEQKLGDSLERLEGVAWRNIFDTFRTFTISSTRVQESRDKIYFDLDYSILETLNTSYLSKISFMNIKDFGEEYFSSKNSENLKKIIHALNRGNIAKAKHFFEINSNDLNEVERLILEDVVSTLEENLKKSIETTTELINLNPKAYVGYLFKSITLFKMNEYEKALEVIEKAIKIIDHFSLICHKAQILMKKYDFEAAFDTINDNLSKYRNNAYLLRTKCLIIFLDKVNWGNLQGNTLNLINSAIKRINTEQLDFLILKAIILCFENRYKEAKEFLYKEIGFDNFIKNPYIGTSAFFITAFSYIARGKFERALEISNRMLTNYADNPISYLTKAMILGYNFIYNFNLKERNDKKFIDMIDLAIDLDPNNSNKAQYYKLKSYVLQVIHGYEKALEVIEVALNLDPKNFNLYIMNAFLLIGNNEYNKALEQIEQLFEDFSQQKNTLYKIKSLILYKMKRYEEGLKIMEDNFDRFPKDFNLLNNKALLLSILNRKEEAIETGKKLIERAPNIGNSHDTYGEILMTFGEYEAAIKELHQALSIDPHGWYIFDTCFKLGKCYKFIGDYNKAREFFEKGKILKERILPYERGIYINNADKFNKEIEQLREQSNKD